METEELLHLLREHGDPKTLVLDRVRSAKMHIVLRFPDGPNILDFGPDDNELNVALADFVHAQILDCAYND